MRANCFFVRGELRVGWVEEWKVRLAIRKMFDHVDARYAQLTEKS